MNAEPSPVGFEAPRPRRRLLPLLGFWALSAVFAAAFAAALLSRVSEHKQEAKAHSGTRETDGERATP